MPPALEAEQFIIAPKAFAAFLAALGDWYTYKFTRKVWGDEAGRCAVSSGLVAIKTPQKTEMQ